MRHFGQRRLTLTTLACFCRDIFWFCVQHDLRLLVTWLPREENQEADHYSKISDSSNWKLNPFWLQRLTGLWGPFDIDLFASFSNHQLPKYYSFFHTPTTAGVNAFCFTWQGNCWCNPPFNLVAKVIQHARSCKTCLCLIVPFWPSARWWPLLVCEKGRAFRGFVHGVLVLGMAPDLFLPGTTGNKAPTGGPAWSSLALGVLFDAPDRADLLPIPCGLTSG